MHIRNGNSFRDMKKLLAILMTLSMLMLLPAVAEESSAHYGLYVGGVEVTPDEYQNLAYQQMFSPLHVVSGDNYDGTGTTMDHLDNFLKGSHTARYVAMQPMS